MSDILGILIAVVIGILAAIPTSLLLVALKRREQSNSPQESQEWQAMQESWQKEQERV